MWKIFHVELKFYKLEFHHFFFFQISLHLLLSVYLQEHKAVTPTNSSLHYRLHSSLHYRCHVRSQLRRGCLRRQKAITCWDDDDEEHRNKIEEGGQPRLRLPHNLLSSSCRSESDRPIAHSDLFFLCSLSLFFVIRSLLSFSLSNRSDHPITHSDLLFLCSSLLFFIVKSFLSSSSSDHSSVLRRQIIGSSSGLFFFKYQNWVLETWFCFLDLEIYVAFSVQLIQHKDSQSESLRLEF